MNNRPLRQPSLALSLAELVTFCDLELISSPFYCTKLGSHVEKNSTALYRRFKDKFIQEFEHFSYLHVHGDSNNHGHDLADCIAFPNVMWPNQTSHWGLRYSLKMYTNNHIVHIYINRYLIKLLLLKDLVPTFHDLLQMSTFILLLIQS